MKNLFFITAIAALVFGCNPKSQESSHSDQSLADSLVSCSPNSSNSSVVGGGSFLSGDEKKSFSQNLKALEPGLPVIGVLMYGHVLTTELTAPMDVFTKHSEDGKQLFNVVTIAETYDMVVSEEGLKMFPDYTFANAPELDIIIVPSAYDMSVIVKNQSLVDFIRKENNNTDFTVSNCAGATLIGESGIADGRKIVTWIGGGEDLQKNYPKLKVQNDAEVSYVEDGKFLSSNGNLASYISALELLEKLTSKEHRKFVESYLYLDRLQNWKK